MRVATGISELELYLDGWNGLSRNAADPNPFYEPWATLPALKSLGEKKDLRFVFIVDQSKHPEELCGYIPLLYSRRYRGLPVGVYRLWSHIHCPVRVPLVKRGKERECVNTFLDWLRSANADASLLEFEGVNADSVFVTHLLADLARRQSPYAELASVERVTLNARETNSEAYFAAAVGKKRWKKLQKLRRQLAERGVLKTELLTAPDELEGWLEEFLQLEAKGWKGRGGTALAATPAERDFFVRSCRGAFAVGQLLLFRMTFDGVPIAMKCVFRSGTSGFVFKTCYDEDYAKYSPGVQLIMDVTRHAHDTLGLDLLDSCAEPDHPMIGHVWAERQTLKWFLVGSGSWQSRFWMRVIGWIRTLKSWVRK